ncbi:hypothetical protein [Streptomyces sp. NPDC057623]|uniref:hypothetical protein n=1 Tax=Streptomyces sp. NPDC057623 TaxID=3346187 RepID=UPI0036742BD2
MNRLAHTLCGLYASSLFPLGYFATTSARNDARWQTATLVALSLLLVVAAVREYLAADEKRAAMAQAERAARPPDPRPAIDGIVAIALAAACCERWWTSAGTDHDPTTCTRKDQTT